MNVAKVVGAFILAMVLAGLSALPASASTASEKRLIAHAKAVVAEVQAESHLTADDVDTELKLDCVDAVLNRWEADKKAESDALFAEAAKDVEGSIAKDFEPAFKGAGNDYTALAHAAQAAAAGMGGGIKHHALIEAAFNFRHAATYRNQEVVYYRRWIAQMRPSGYECLDKDVQQGAFVEQGNAEREEKEAVDNLQFALKHKGTALHLPQPESFKVHVALTATEATHMVMPSGGPGLCGEFGAASGTATETADFPPFVVLPSGAIQPTTSSPAAVIGGTWNASGSYAPEGQCEFVRTFACNGGFVMGQSGIPYATLAITAEKSSLARAQVELPDIGESGEESCPDGSQWQAYIPLPLMAHEIAAHADKLAFALDGSALRGHFEPLTVEDAIEQLGPAEPGLDCTPAFTLATTCTTQGSQLHVVITVQQVGG